MTLSEAVKLSKEDIKIEIYNINDAPKIKIGGEDIENIIRCQFDWNTNDHNGVNIKKIHIEYYDEDQRKERTITNLK